MNATILYNECPICNSPLISQVLNVEDYTVSHNIFSVWHCQACTGRFTQYAPAKEFIGKFYQAEDYISHTDTRKGIINNLYHRVRKITLGTKAALIKKVSECNKGKILDFGAGTGAFAATMRDHQWEVTALEPDEAARENAKKNYNLALRPVSDIHQISDQSFDAITLWHVLEHLHDLHEDLRSFSRLLKTKGRLIIAVPNYTSYDCRVYQQYWAAYDVPRHLYHFSPQAMKILLENHGFEIVEQKPMWFDSFYVSMLSERYKTGKQNLMRAVFTGFLSNLKAVFIPATCSSVIYICRKKKI